MKRTRKGAKKTDDDGISGPLPPSTKAKTDDDRPSLTLTPVMLGVAWVIVKPEPLRLGGQEQAKEGQAWAV